MDTIESDVPIEEQAAAAEAFTQGLVDTFDLGAQAKSVIDDEVVVVEVTGDNLGLLVGPKGATLHAIEELVRTVVQRQTDGHGVRIHVDVAGYRAKRREALADFTRNLAEKVLETGRPQALEPMSASDRKVVHDTAAEIDGIATDPRARTRVAAWCCARLDRTARAPERSRPGPAPVEVLEEARQRGFLGPGPVERQLEHAGISPARSAGSPDLPRPRERRRGPRPRARPEWPDVAGCCSTPSGDGAASSRCRRNPRTSMAACVCVRAGRGARPAPSSGHVRPRGRPLVRAPGRDRRVRGGVPPRWRSLVVTEPPEGTRVAARWPDEALQTLASVQRRSIIGHARASP